jgi:hypothetical protein
MYGELPNKPTIKPGSVPNLRVVGKAIAENRNVGTVVIIS